ncbi:MAG: GtrA family protein [Candidatus Falkowbacteria bacterium]|nr:GtrA family protein [Candidatus Falkowbacteria bacterium]
MLTKQQFFKIVRFCQGGVVGVSLFYLTFYTLTKYVGLWYLFSSIIAYVLNWLANFTIQKFWTFRNKNAQAIPKQLSLYFGVAILFLALNTGSLYVLVKYGHLAPLLAQLILTVLLSIASYFTTQKIFAP